jgi:hypothetical protein
MDYTQSMLEIVKSDTYEQWFRKLKDRQAQVRINLKTSPQRHRDTEKGDESTPCGPAASHPWGDSVLPRRSLYFLCVLCASVVQLSFSGSMPGFSGFSSPATSAM